MIHVCPLPTRHLLIRHENGSKDLIINLTESQELDALDRMLVFQNLPPATSWQDVFMYSVAQIATTRSQSQTNVFVNIIY